MNIGSIVLLSLVAWQAVVVYAPPPGRAKATLSKKDIVRDNEWLKKHFGLETIPSPIDRVSNITPEQFAEYARSGKPLIVTDIADSWKMRNWTCDSIQKDFGNEKIMAWNYNEDGAKGGKQFYRLKENWRDQAMELGHSRTTDGKSPKRVSFHWYPIQQGAEDMDYERPGGDDYTSTLASPKSRRKIKAAFQLPYFVEDTVMNREFCKNRIEFFLSMPGSGAALHTDSVCEPIFSVQLSGAKQWRLSPIPAFIDPTHQKAADEFGRFGTWGAIWDDVVQPGEALFFPPSMLHETRSASEGCAISASLQIRYPFAAGFIRDFARRLVNSNECAFCFEHWAPFVIGHKDGVREIYRRVAKRGSIPDVLQDLFNDIDANRDGMIDKKEKEKHFEWEIRKHRGQVEYTAREESLDFIAYNDLDKDGQVSYEEYAKLHEPLSKWYREALDSPHGSCDEDGCGPWVKRAVLESKLSGIESAYHSSAGEKYDVGSNDDQDGDEDEDL